MRKILSNVRFEQYPSKTPIKVICGPRKVGKTTSVKALITKSDIYYKFEHRKRDQIKVLSALIFQADKEKKSCIYIDNVHKINDWWDVIGYYNLVFPDIAIIVISSSKSAIYGALKSGVTNESNLFHVTHWNFKEANDTFKIDLKTYVEFGCYPDGFPKLPNFQKWKDFIINDIVQESINEELAQLATTTKKKFLKNLLKLCVKYPAQVLSYKKIREEILGIGSFKKAQKLFQHLQSANLVSIVPSFSYIKSPTKQSNPKIVIHDNGLIRAFEELCERPLNPIRYEYYVKNAVGARLLEAGLQVYYWARNKNYVDFIARDKKGMLYAICAFDHVPHTHELEGLRYFYKKNAGVHPLVVISDDVYNEKYIYEFEALKLSDVLSIDSNNYRILEGHRDFYKEMLF